MARRAAARSWSGWRSDSRERAEPAVVAGAADEAEQHRQAAGAQRLQKTKPAGELNSSGMDLREAVLHSQERAFEVSIGKRRRCYGQRKRKQQHTRSPE